MEAKTVQSMTGYGWGQANRDGRQLLLELKAVNHRFLDISFRLPKALVFLEDGLRRFITASEIGRGHVDVFVTYQNDREDAHTVKLDIPLLKACDDACRQAGALLNDPRTTDVAEVLRLSGALSIAPGEEDAEQVTALAREAFEEAARALLQMRRQEGDALKRDLAGHLEALRNLVEQISLRADSVPKAYRERLLARLAEWDVATVEPQRIAQEVATMADRCAIAEELSRLHSHMEQFAQGLESEGEIGRKLDFLLQEMNREVNTIGSKASETEISRCVVDAKCVIEKLREQVQNVV